MTKRSFKPLITVLFTVLLSLSVLFAASPEAYAAAVPVTSARDPSAGRGSAPDGKVYLIGEPAGVRLLSDGVIVAGTAGVLTAHGSVSPAADAGLREGDVILRVNGKKIESSDDLTGTVENSQGKTLFFTVRRGSGPVRRIAVTPVYSTVDNRYRAGVWINDGVSGIGVISFVEPDTLMFCAVGHPLGEETGGASDDDPDRSVFSRGILENITLTGVRKGTRGIPGELIGYLGGTRLGNVTENGRLGVFGRLSGRELLSEYSGALYSVAPCSEVKEGPAELYIRLPGSEVPRLYDIIIEKIERGGENITKNLTVRVTDKRLLQQTGGIVQGMSGTPIIQSGKFAASLTHVFVSDPTRGYAVFAEKTTEHCKKIHVSP